MREKQPHPLTPAALNASAQSAASFYDMNKRPIICPNCGAEYAGFDKQNPARPGRG